MGRMGREGGRRGETIKPTLFTSFPRLILRPRVFTVNIYIHTFENYRVGLRTLPPCKPH